jgi:hypothetical protein
LKIELIPFVKTLNEVIVNVDRDKNREAYLRQFRNEFFGHFAEKCNILNEEIIDAYVDKKDQLIAEALAPLEIENDILGIEFFLFLKTFILKGTEYSITGYSLFQQMPAESERILKRWNQNRDNAYLVQ